MTDDQINQAGQGSSAERRLRDAAARFHCPRPCSALSRKFDLSERQAYRYLEEATHLDRPVEVSEATVPMTLKLPAGTARLLRAYARSSGLTIGAIVTRALAAFLNTQRRHG